MLESDPKNQTPGQQNKDELLNIKDIIKQGSKSVPVDALLKKGYKSVNVLREDKLNGLIRQAVRNILKTYKPMSEEETAKDAQKEFFELLNRYQNLEHTKKDIETSRDELSRELTTMKEELTEENIQSVKELATWQNLQEELRQTVFGAIDSKIVALKDDHKNLCFTVDEIESVRQDFTRILNHAVEFHKLKLEELTKLEHQKTIDILQKRISKLSDALKANEDALRKIGESHIYSNQEIKLILNKVGLDASKPDYQKKIGLLKAVFDQNIELQKQKNQQQ
ncbi:MAG: hypothetical protein HZA48_05490 [Planctomycetes bacterium]|nr:hypothetical protein [Planctomycetota bacterium]